MEQQLAQSRAALLAADVAESVMDRFDAALLSAQFAAAAALQIGVDQLAADVLWRVLPRRAPELAEWAACFDQASVKRSRAYPLTAREADDLLRDAQGFHDVVRSRCRRMARRRQVG